MKLKLYRKLATVSSARKSNPFEPIIVKHVENVYWEWIIIALGLETVWENTITNIFCYFYYMVQYFKINSVIGTYCIICCVCRLSKAKTSCLLTHGKLIICSLFWSIQHCCLGNSCNIFARCSNSYADYEYHNNIKFR